MKNMTYYFTIADTADLPKGGKDNAHFQILLANGFVRVTKGGNLLNPLNWQIWSRREMKALLAKGHSALIHDVSKCDLSQMIW